jgi:hypothetical protein
VDLDALVAKVFEVKADKYYTDYGFSSNTYDYTDEDLYMLAQVISAEARGESFKGKIAVGNVVMNRVLSRGYPGSTIKEVISANGQFAVRWPTIKPDSSSKRAAAQVLVMENWVIPQNVYFFKVSATKDDWGSHRYSTTIGHHAFYTGSYSGRYGGDKVPPKMYERITRWPQIGCKKSTRVTKIQRVLRSLSYDIKADGAYGKDMMEAVQKFQKDHGLRADGVAGPDTLVKMIKIYGVEKFVKNFASK